LNKSLLTTLLIIIIQFAFGQTDSLSLNTEIDTTVKKQTVVEDLESSTNNIKLDTSLTVIDTLAEEQDTIIGFFNIFKGEPGRAALYSLIVPGGGQIYNKKWIKAPIIIATDAVAFGIAIYWTREYNVFNAEYTKYVNGEPNIYLNINQTTLISQRNLLRKYRDYSWFAAGIVHLITVVEAFVDRHLLEFDMNEDLTLEVIAIKDPYSITFASLNYTF